MKHPIPIEVLDQHLVALGKTGSGKSWMLRGLYERLLDKGKRVCIIDPKGDHYGIKLSTDGKSAGYSVMAFGDFKNPKASDMHINSKSGKEIGALIADGNRPCVIGFRGWMPSDMTEFWIDFASTLFNKIKSPLYLGVDEVHNFATKAKIMSPQAGLCLHWTNRLMSEARGLGLHMMIASQRPQKVHNDTLTCAETLIAMRVTHPSDRIAFHEWLKEYSNDNERGKLVLSSLSEMKTGEAFVWSPEIGFFERVTFPPIKTYDSFRAPKEGKERELKGWAEVDLDEVRARLPKLVEEAKANDPAELKKKIRELENQIRNQKPAAKIDESVLTRAVEKARQETLREHSGHIKQLEAVVAKQQRMMKEAADKLIGTAIDLPKMVMVEAHTRMSTPPSTIHARSPEKPLHRSRSVDITEEIKLKTGERKMLEAAVRWHPEKITAAQIRTQGGISHVNTFSTYKNRLIGFGLIIQDGDSFIATQEGIDYLGGEINSPTTTEEMMNVWTRHFKSGERNILEYLVYQLKGKPISASELMEAAGIQHPNTFSTYKNRLKAACLIVESNGMIAANKETLFL